MSTSSPLTSLLMEHLLKELELSRDQQRLDEEEKQRHEADWSEVSDHGDSDLFEAEQADWKDGWLDG